jgi:putative mRNA 3-end processing factor
MRIPCNGIHIGLDSPGGDLPFLSHAHSDHTNGIKREQRIIAAPETLELAGLDAEPAEPQNTKLLDAGHILGARQLAVENDGERTVYTGDFCTKPNIFGMKAEIPNCDRLIMEATYGNPDYVFPPHEEVHEMVRRWVSNNDSSNLIIGCYELGKAQEMVKILNGCSIAPVVTEKTESFCSIYEKYGHSLDRIVLGTDEAEEAMSRRFVAIVPMGKAKRYFAHRLARAFERETLCAVATGWALHYRFNTDAAFPLSDHSDFNDLVDYVAQTGAKKVEFFCGDGSRVLEAASSRSGAVLNL